MASVFGWVVVEGSSGVLRFWGSGLGVEQVSLEEFGALPETLSS